MDALTRQTVTDLAHDVRQLEAKITRLTVDLAECLPAVDRVAELEAKIEALDRVIRQLCADRI